MQATVAGKSRPASLGGSLARMLFATTYFSWLWLVLRVYVGYQWLESGRQKIVDSKWMDSGVALKGFWERAVQIPEQGRPPIVYGWYRDFIQFMLDQGWYSWFAKLLAVGELLVGIALIAGALVGFAALMGAFMNVNFMLAGTASTNPVLFVGAILLVVAWKVAGYWGFDRVLLKVPGLIAERVAQRRPEPVPGLAAAPQRACLCGDSCECGTAA